MLDLSVGELFIVVFIVVAVISATWWPRLGEAIAERLHGGGAADAPDTHDEGPGPR